jgi:glycosyltransferase involved in cell wall biosynthesis
MKIVVLYEELAGYFMACITRFAEKYDARVLIIRKETNATAPFEFKNHPLIEILERNSLPQSELEKRIFSFEPDAVFCAGWSNEFYLKISKHFKPSIPVILGFDNQWTGSFKQRLRVIAAKRYFKNHFTNCFVPGKLQAVFAEHLGFSSENYRTGAYSCDTDFFTSIYESTQAFKKENFPKRFIFSGRYTAVKGIELLWNTFLKLRSETKRDWELWCIGKGEIEPLQAEGIRHFGFVQPENLGKIMKDCGVFILPSNFEPWGVVVHEFAAAGFPLLLSDKVGAGEIFLKEPDNGFRFDSENGDSLLSSMKTIVSLNDSQLLEMGKRSHEISLSITPDKWSATLYDLIHVR